jgi:hypothetical protein
MSHPSDEGKRENLIVYKFLAVGYEPCFLWNRQQKYFLTPCFYIFSDSLPNFYQHCQRNHIFLSYRWFLIQAWIKRLSNFFSWLFQSDWKKKTFFIKNIPTDLPRKQLSEYYSNFQIKMFKSPMHLMTFCTRIRIVLTSCFRGKTARLDF